jgi:hypothetical protein
MIVQFAASWLSKQKNLVYFLCGPFNYQSLLRSLIGHFSFSLACQSADDSSEWLDETTMKIERKIYL